MQEHIRKNQYTLNPSKNVTQKPEEILNIKNK